MIHCFARCRPDGGGRAQRGLLRSPPRFVFSPLQRSSSSSNRMRGDDYSGTISSGVINGQRLDLRNVYRYGLEMSRLDETYRSIEIQKATSGNVDDNPPLRKHGLDAFRSISVGWSQSEERAGTRCQRRLASHGWTENSRPQVEGWTRMDRGRLRVARRIELGEQRHFRSFRIRSAPSFSQPVVRPLVEGGASSLALRHAVRPGLRVRLPGACLCLAFRLVKQAL